MKDTAFGETKEYSKISVAFHKMYQSTLQEIVNRIDLDELELNQDIFLNEDSIYGINTKSVNGISLKWQILNAEIIDSEKKEFNSEFESAQFASYSCHNILKCAATSRIKFIMNLYKDHFLKSYVYDDANCRNNDDAEYADIFMQCLSSYSTISLLNDYQHIVQHHLQSNNNENSKYYRNCSNGIDDDCCDMLLKKFRDSNYDNNGNNDNDGIFDVYLKGLDERQQILIEISSKIHCYLSHTKHCHDEEKKDNDDDERESNQFQIRSIKWRKTDNDKYNKFLNEVCSDNSSEKEEIGSMDELYSILVSSGLSISDSISFINDEIIYNEWDTEAIIIDLNDDDPFNRNANSNLFMSLNYNHYYTKKIKNHFKIQNNDNDKLPQFTFGMERLYHWNFHKNRDAYVDKPKYGSMKEEFLNNKIYPIDLKTFHQFLTKAYLFAKSSKGKSFKAADRGGENNDYEVPANLPLSVSHLLPLLVYCNLTPLQYNYKKWGCRETKPDQSLAELITNNKEIGHWYKYFFEAIKFYGTAPKEGDILFTGLKVRLLFKSFAPRWNSPFSTSVDWNIAHQFSEEAIILTLVPVSVGGDRYFNTEWFSDYQKERERLFSHAYHLRIEDIQSFDKLKIQYNEKYLRAFNVWSSIFCGNYFNLMLRLRKKKKINTTNIDQINQKI